TTTTSTGEKGGRALPPGRPAPGPPPARRARGPKAPPPCPASSTPTADAACQTTPAVDQHFCNPSLDAFRACPSRLPGKRARPVPRGRRRGNAPPLPDWKPPYYLLEAEGFECRLLNTRRLGCPGPGGRQTLPP